MTESEAQSVRNELHAFRDEWTEVQRRRNLERRWAVGLVVPIAAMYVAATISWGWNLSAAVALNAQHIEQGIIIDARRFPHETRIAVLESRLLGIERSLDDILEQLRQDYPRGETAEN